MIRHRACPRCRGDLVIDRDQYGWYQQCLQCGYQRDFEVEVIVVKQPAAQASAGRGEGGDEARA